jgi:hypothetical protein
MRIGLYRECVCERYHASGSARRKSISVVTAASLKEIRNGVKSIDESLLIMRVPPPERGHLP